MTLRGAAAVVFIPAALACGGGMANATPVFDVDAYSTCTATTAPGPNQDFDAVVSACCVSHAGVPAPTNYGLGCAAPMDAASAVDERPVIVLPMRPASTEDPDVPVPDPLP
jgi:hypothetical protein